VIDALTQRLINVSARKSRVVKVQTFSAKSVSLTKQIKAKEIEVSDANKALRESRDFFSQLMELDEELRNELEAAIDAKKDRIISFRIHNSSQEIKKKELLFRLEEKLKMTRVEQEECDRKIHSLERTVCNLNDDLIELREEMALEERPLIDRVLNQRSYRCVAMNSSNTASQNDVTGGNGCSEYVALSNGKECYIHDINSGELQTVFMGDNKGRHVGPLVGHSATITAMYFHDKNVYTGSLDASIICWKIDSTAKLFECKGHEGAITCIFSDGAKTLSGSADKTIIVWSSEGLLLHRITGHVGGVHHIQCCLSWFVSSSYEKIFVWELINLQD
jgi:WD40 repeat protein